MDNYILLRNSSDPVKKCNTSHPLDIERNTLCIVQCENKEEAASIFRKQFPAMIITPERVVKVQIINTLTGKDI